MNLVDRRIVVIGGTSGIGLAVAEAAAAAGGQVIVASSSQHNVKRAVDLLPEGTQGYQLDATDEEAVRALFSDVGEFDHLVYTAGDYLIFKPIREISLAQARSSFEVRYWGAFMAVKYGAPGIRPAGSISLTSGIIATRPAPNLTAPASATGAVESLVRALAVELAPLRVNAVRLGPVGRKAQEGSEHDQAELYRTISQKMLTKRMGTPSEAASSYLYLMQNGFSTGTVLVPDGGFTLA
jgi:NAD(P)-dependent dehydrogenase (short-subunit alcohol dehydrogenase family)